MCHYYEKSPSAASGEMLFRCRDYTLDYDRDTKLLLTLTHINKRTSWCLTTFFFLFFGEGTPQLMLRTHRSLKAYCATPVMKMKMGMSSFLPSFTSNGAPVE
jgi:hypothetical protein